MAGMDVKLICCGKCSPLAQCYKKTSKLIPLHSLNIHYILSCYVYLVIFYNNTCGYCGDLEDQMRKLNSES